MIAIVLTVLWFWNRYLAASPEPQEAFSRLSMLGRLAAVGPRPHQTPYQFGARLAAALPGCQPQLHIVTDTYVPLPLRGEDVVGPGRRPVDRRLDQPALSAAAPGDFQEGNVSQYKYHLFELSIGWVGLIAGDKGLLRLSMKPTPQEVLEELDNDLNGAENDPAPFTDIEGRLERYAAGDVSALDSIQLDLSGAPPFFRAAWNACRRIPPGETRSYAWLAAEAGSPLAMRAAGQAMARKPVPAGHTMPSGHRQRRRPRRIRRRRPAGLRRVCCKWSWRRQTRAEREPLPPER